MKKNECISSKTNLIHRICHDDKINLIQNKFASRYKIANHTSGIYNVPRIPISFLNAFQRPEK